MLNVNHVIVVQVVIDIDEPILMFHLIVINVFQNLKLEDFVLRLIVLLMIIVNVIYLFHLIIVYLNLQVYDNVQQIVMIQIDIDYIKNDKHHIQYVILLLHVDEMIIHRLLPYVLQQEPRRRKKNKKMR
jgi:hypothetical protein